MVDGLPLEPEDALGMAEADALSLCWREAQAMLPRHSRGVCIGCTCMTGHGQEACEQGERKERRCTDCINPFIRRGSLGIVPDRSCPQPPF